MSGGRDQSDPSDQEGRETSETSETMARVLPKRHGSSISCIHLMSPRIASVARIEAFSLQVERLKAALRKESRRTGVDVTAGPLS